MIYAPTVQGKYIINTPLKSTLKGVYFMTRRKDGLYQEVLREKGKKPKYFYGKTKSDVLRQIKEYKEKQETGRFFKEVAEEWWEEHEAEIEWNTAKSYKPAKNRAVEEFGGTPIKDITPPQISRYIKNFSKTRADKTVRTQLLIFNLIFKYAVEMGDVPFNPVRDLSVPPGLPKTKITSPSQEDIKIVKKSTNCTFGMFAYMAMYTGLREGELLALDWNTDVDKKNRIIHVNKSVYFKSNKACIKKPKTEASVGSVPILDKLYDKLKPKRKGPVFCDENGERLTKSQFEKLWKTYKKETGITATPHQFRHAYATMLFEAGIPPEEMQILLRHAQLSTTMDIYTDIRDNKQKQTFEKVYNIDIV